MLIPETQLSPEATNRDDPTNPDNFRYALPPCSGTEEAFEGDYLGAGLGSAVPPPEKIAVDVENDVPMTVEVRCY